MFTNRVAFSKSLVGSKISGKIFINYRRDDSSASAGRLAARFPKNQIFIDVDNLDPGVDFVEEIEQSVGVCDVLIAVIGSRWLISSEAEGSRRLDNPDDFVRIEIATALKRNIRVIPVLVYDALMPRASDLPDDLKALVRRNAVEVSHTRSRRSWLAHLPRYQSVPVATTTTHAGCSRDSKSSANRHYL